jgi:hypothetical protein
VTSWRDIKQLPVYAYAAHYSRILVTGFLGGDKRIHVRLVRS